MDDYSVLFGRHWVQGQIGDDEILFADEYFFIIEIDGFFQDHDLVDDILVLVEKGQKVERRPEDMMNRR